jgi:hypothetical protein
MSHRGSTSEVVSGQGPGFVGIKFCQEWWVFGNQHGDELDNIQLVLYSSCSFFCTFDCSNYL